MKILTKKQQNYIAKRIAALYYIVEKWDDNHWEEFAVKSLDLLSDIAFAIGGESMMSEVPLRVEELRRLCEKARGHEQEL